MTAQTVQRLREIARADPAVAPLARLQAEALEAADATWESGVPAFDRSRLDDALPLLHGQTLTVDVDRVRSLLNRLASIAAAVSETAGSDLRRRLGNSALDPLALLEASIAQDATRLDALAAEAAVDAGLLATLGGLAALPLLQACGRKAAPLLERQRWDAGYCPVCGAWPALAELRGLEKRRWLRCARCGSGWEVAQDGCVFCGESDWRRLAYLAAEGDTESRRATTCESCRGYLKTLASLIPIAPADVAVTDLLTLELDMAALERDFARPELPPLPLEVHVQAAKKKSIFSRVRS